MATPLILDANNIAKRAILTTAMDDLKAGGVFTGGVYNTWSMLAAIPGHIGERVGLMVAFWDGGTPPTRKALIPTYKRGRSRKSSQLSEGEYEQAMEQLGMVRELMDVLGILNLAYKDREADDACMAAARLFVERGQSPVVVSGDRDLLQVVHYGARVWNFKRLVDADNFHDVTGVYPEHYLLYRALTGDVSDSIPGAGGCGEKRASQLIGDVHAAMGFAGADPRQQLEAVVGYIRQSKKARRVYERNIVARRRRLSRVLEGIDLTRHFGGTHGLEADLENRPPAAWVPMARLASQYGFQSVLASPNRFIRPFTDAAGRRGV
jgi:5'-3' exonuclease